MPTIVCPVCRKGLTVKKGIKIVPLHKDYDEQICEGGGKKAYVPPGSGDEIAIEYEPVEE